MSSYLAEQALLDFAAKSDGRVTVEGREVRIKLSQKTRDKNGNEIESALMRRPTAGDLEDMEAIAAAGDIKKTNFLISRLCNLPPEITRRLDVDEDWYYLNMVAGFFLTKFQKIGAS